ncbi:hypothetical protein OSB04_un000645 [Centaurea solstitialis]|uniref:Integrase catalytic domain-containing protein n=1 Tax=Centaurea solstitialis TaxID=347529 RepID=A0AA38SHB2_9ASTR|nr:hypothetical protein OSB04_un000645 [Centaurea solstitialis]
MDKQTSDLYYVVQKSGETIRDYFNIFDAAMIEVKNCDVKTAIEAYKRGLDDSSGLYLELTKYPPENFDDMRARTLAFMRIEDDALFQRKHSNEKKPLSAQKHDFKHKRVNKIGNPRYESKTRPNKGTSKNLVDSLRKIDANVRWPKTSENPSKDKDQNKWCDFHEDHGHTTDECISLKKERHLKGVIPNEQGRPASPAHTKVINCITGGSEVCGLTYSAAKRHAREGPDEHPIPDEVKSKAEKELDAMIIAFDQDDTQGVHHEHHDALVILLTIKNCLTKRILIDGGSSANVIFTDTLKVIGIERSEIVRRSFTLIGFNRDSMNTLGEIILPVFAKGINKQTKFNVIDCQSTYNAILGRPWIHEMKAIPSTYHQKIKFPSPWGIQEISQDGKRSNDDLRLEEIVLDPEHPDRKVFVGASLPPDIKNTIISFLQEHSDCFAWSHADMVGIDPNVISHKLNVDPTFKPIKKNGKWRVFGLATDIEDQVTVKDQDTISIKARLEPTLDSIPIIHLMTSSIEAKEKVQMIEEVYNWSLDIWNHLKYDRLPDDKMEARKTKSKASRYTIFEGKLYRRSTSGLILRCITSKEHMNQILQEMHDGECGNHSGGRNAIRYVQRCDACQRHSGTSHLPSEPLHSVLIPWPFMRWGMDIVGKLPPAPRQKVFLVVLTDYFSKWIEAVAFSQVRDKEVISFIQTNIIYRFGVPSEIMCDNGSQFISEKTRKFCDERGIRLITSTPRYPQSNGLAESSNKVIINSIRKRLKEAKGKWVEELPSVLWANRTTPRTSTGQTPFSLVYGCEAVLPIESQLPIARHRTMEQNVIDLYYDLDALEELREKAFQKMALQKAMVERHFNKKVKAKIFQVGDYVLRQVFQNTQELNAGKLSIKWEGPYIISKIIGNGAYKLTTIEGKEIPRSWNATHLKRYYF